jgi:salicylate hydroxylase
VNFSTAVVTTQTGEVVQGDMVLCADGLWSDTRSQFLERDAKPYPTGDLAYRIVLHINDLSGPDADELRQFIKSQQVNFWIGPQTHVVAYAMRAGTLYNIVLLCPDTLPADVSKTTGDLDEMRTLFEGWDPLLRKFLNQVKKVEKWKLMYHSPLQKWCNPAGRFWMAGDACHPMLPYLAQGANSSLEDGAVVGFLLGKVDAGRKEEQLPKAASMYEKLRKGRGERIQEETWRQREDFHLSDGEEQRERDRVFAEWREKEVGIGEEVVFPSRWQGGRVQKWLYGYDAYEEAERPYEKDPF